MQGAQAHPCLTPHIHLIASIWKTLNMKCNAWNKESESPMKITWPISLDNQGNEN
jgi:hypothetical protein